VQIDGGDHVSLRYCRLRNAGRRAIEIDGHDHLVERCVIEDTGEGAITVDGGDRLSLTPSGHVIRNSEIRRFGRWCWTYNPAVYIESTAIGVTVEHNELHHAPHTAILYGGNDHVLQLNEIHHVCQVASDAGAIYTGRDWSAQGTAVRHNFIHHVETIFPVTAVQGVYLDDCASGQTVTGNVLYAIDAYGIQSGGGRDNTLDNNIMASCNGALTTDNRGVEHIDHDPGSSWNMLDKIEAMNYQDPPWDAAYSRLAVIPDDWGVISDTDHTYWLYPEGCTYSRNVAWNVTTSIYEYSYGGDGSVTAVYDDISDNLDDTDPLFVDEASLDLSLQPGSPVLDIPGWEEIPFDLIGIEPS
jgi:hypothetical protein